MYSRTEDKAERAQAVWKKEIEKRIADIDSGYVKTVAAELAEKMIRGAH